MNFKIVVDSSADMLEFKDIPFSVAPLKISTAQTEFIDNITLDVKQMVDYLSEYKGKSGTACPSVGDWLNAFEGGENIFCITITSGLSGSYNAACIAKKEYEQQNPNAQVFVIDSLSAGPKLRMVAEKLAELIAKGESFSQICVEICEYAQNIGTFFMLESLNNLANNGRVGVAAAKIAGILGIRAIGQASSVGKIELLNKCRGEKKALQSMLSSMEIGGYKGGKASIAHCFNLQGAKQLKELILSKFPTASVDINPTRGLCSFYAEKGGLILGYEKI